MAARPPRKHGQPTRTLTRANLKRGFSSMLKPSRPGGRPGGGHEAERIHRAALVWDRCDVRALDGHHNRTGCRGPPRGAQEPTTHTREQAVGSVQYSDTLAGAPAAPNPHAGPSAPLVGGIETERERESPSPSPQPQPPAPAQKELRRPPGPACGEAWQGRLARTVKARRGYR